MIKGIYKKAPSHTTLSAKRLNITRTGNKKGSLYSSPLFNIVLEFLASAIRQEKEIKRMQSGKK